QDHKRIFDDDLGPNTGGMGAFAPSPLMNDALQRQIEHEIVQPVLKGMAAEGHPFRGFLYCGLMLTPDGPKVIEFNVRFGDPEAQVVLPLLTGSLAATAEAVALQTSLHPMESDGVSRRCAVGIVLAAHGYPGDVRTGD